MLNQVGWILWAAVAVHASEAKTGVEPKAAAESYIEEIRSGRFRTRGCERVSGSAWVKFLLLGQPVKHRLTFREGCDVEGTLTITRSPFLIDLKVRKLKDAQRLRATLVPEIHTDLMKQRVRVRVDAKDGVLSKPGRAGQALLGFLADYEAESGLDGKAEHNPGGKLTVTRYLDRPVSGVEVPLKIR